MQPSHLLWIPVAAYQSSVKMRVSLPIALTELPPLFALWLSIDGYLLPVVAALAVVVAALAVGYRQTAGLTLRAAWWWCLPVLGLLVLGILTGSETDRTWGPEISPLGYLTAVATFAPLMSLLGAKRPQAKAWQFIVLTLLVVLALPAAARFLPGRGLQPNLHSVQLGFLAILWFVGVGNGVGTPYWPSYLLYAAAQAVLLLPLWSRWQLGPTQAIIVALWLLALAAGYLLVYSWGLSTRRADPLDRLWLDFRNRYGVVWSLRVQERFNAAVRKHHWPWQLTWQGFRPSATVEEAAAKQATGEQATGELAAPPGDKPQAPALPTAKQRSDMTRALRALLMRFVSPQWIDDRSRCQ